MSGPDRLHEGQVEGRTAVPGEFQPGVDRGAQAVDPGIAQVEQLLGSLAPQAALPGLVDTDPDTVDLIGRVAEHVNGQRRARGRPAGSANRRNDEMFDYLEARGFKGPELRMMEIISADPRELAAALAGPEAKAANVPFDRAMEVLRLQAKCAEAMLPYKFAKKQELKVEHSGGQVHVMMAGPLTRPGDTPATAFDLTGGADAQTVEYQEVKPGAPEQFGREQFGRDGQAVDAATQSPDKPAL